MTQAEITAAINALLASGQPITALIHRNAEGVIITELYNAASRAAVLATVDAQTALAGGDELLLFRGGTGYRVPATLFGGASSEHFRGAYNLSVTNQYPAAGGGSGPAGAIKAGDEYYVSIAGTLNLPGVGVTDIYPGALIKALVDTPGTTNTNWKVIQ